MLRTWHLKNEQHQQQTTTTNNKKNHFMPYMLFVLHYYMINIMHAEYILDSISLFLFFFSLDIHRYIFRLISYIFSLQYIFFHSHSSSSIWYFTYFYFVFLFYFDIMFFLLLYFIPIFILAHHKNQ